MSKVRECSVGRSVCIRCVVEGVGMEVMWVWVGAVVGGLFAQ